MRHIRKSRARTPQRKGIETETETVLLSIVGMSRARTPQRKGIETPLRSNSLLP